MQLCIWSENIVLLWNWCHHCTKHYSSLGRIQDLRKGMWVSSSLGVTEAVAWKSFWKLKAVSSILYLNFLFSTRYISGTCNKIISHLLWLSVLKFSAINILTTTVENLNIKRLWIQVNFKIIIQCVMVWFSVVWFIVLVPNLKSNILVPGANYTR